MKAALITYHQVYNYGSSLQAYATKKTIENNGCEVEIINYVPERFRNYGSIRQTYQEKAYYNKNPLKCLLITLFCMPSRRKQKRVFSQFDDYLALGEEVYQESLHKLNNCFDLYFTGSDQVWNNHFGGFDSAFFLDFLRNKNCYAYGASFGKDQFEKKEKDYLKKALSKYRRISVRENTGVEIVNSLGYAAIQLLDPIYALSVQEWLTIAEPRVIEEDYILIYQLNSKNALLEKAIELQAAEKIPRIVVIEYERRRRDRRATYEALPPVNRFLSLVAHAKYVVTDSFHGTSFSLKFNRDFFVALPPNFQGRIKSVLQLVGLESRMINNNHKITRIAKEQIDWDHVNTILSEEVKRNCQFIKECIADARSNMEESK